MKPILECKQMMKEHGLNFLSVLDEHLTEGYVYSGDDCFVMASTENRESLLGICLNKDVDNDTWFVYAYVGELKRVLELIPFRLKYVAFRRDNGNMKMYQTDNLLRKLETL